MTGIGLNVVAGAIVHIVLLFVFFAWAGQSDGNGFKIPADSKMLVVIAVVLAVVGIVIATRRGRRLVRTHVLELPQADRGRASSGWRARPRRLAALFGGSSA